MMKVKDKILSVMNKHRMISYGDTVVIGVSGGADSMCLLSFFNKISMDYGLNIICAHVNHGIRGIEADRDEDFVRSYCFRNNIRFECAHFDVPSASSETGESEEQCGRRLRYEFFSSFGDNVKIATAHNLNDSEETFLFNLTRGTGLKGLTGIPPVRGNIIRPLIECTRNEIEEYLVYNDTDFVTDSTNLNDEYTRNRIRHNVIPVLSEINPSFHSAFLNCISALSQTDDFVAQEVKIAFEKAQSEQKFRVSEICSLHTAVKNRLIMEICSYYGAYDISAKHISLINDILSECGAVVLCGGVTIACDGKFLYKVTDIKDDTEIKVLYTEEKDTFVFPGGTICVSQVDNESVKAYNSRQFSENSVADADKIIGAVFRSRCEGDRFRYPCREHSKSLKNLFKENNITPQDRAGIPFLADDEHILWINGVGVSHYAVPDGNTKRFIKITLQKG